MTLQCGICGHQMKAKDLVMVDVVPAEGESTTYHRIVHPDCDGLTPEQIEAGINDGSIKRVPDTWVSDS